MDRTIEEPRPYRWTKDEYYRMVDSGLFLERRVELIDGEVVEMPAQFNTHAAALTLTHDALRQAFGPKYWVRVQMTLDLSPYSVPDPDVAVISGSPRGVTGRANPKSALLVVEVSESTLGFDRNRKAAIYAAAGIADYWIVNLVQRQLEVFRRPVADPAAPLGWRYAPKKIYDPGDSVAPLGARKSPVAVADLFP
jgi:Uma2 family endonuclease